MKIAGTLQAYASGCNEGIVGLSAAGKGGDVLYYSPTVFMGDVARDHGGALDGKRNGDWAKSYLGGKAN